MSCNQVGTSFPVIIFIVRPLHIGEPENIQKSLYVGPVWKFCQFFFEFDHFLSFFLPKIYCMYRMDSVQTILTKIFKEKGRFY